MPAYKNIEGDNTVLFCAFVFLAAVCAAWGGSMTALYFSDRFPEPRDVGAEVVFGASFEPDCAIPHKGTAGSMERLNDSSVLVISACLGVYVMSSPWTTATPVASNVAGFAAGLLKFASMVASTVYASFVREAADCHYIRVLRGTLSPDADVLNFSLWCQ